MSWQIVHETLQRTRRDVPPNRIPPGSGLRDAGVATGPADARHTAVRRRFAQRAAAAAAAVAVRTAVHARYRPRGIGA